MQEDVKYFVDLIFGVVVFLNALFFVPQFIKLKIQEVFR
jgi:hypothetical protein